MSRAFAVLALSGGFALDTAAQEQPTPPSADGLPEVLVEQPQPAPGKKQTEQESTSKSDQTGAKAGKSAEPPGSNQTTENGGETGPGLNLTKPTSTGSRLDLTPLETPASIETIPGTTIRDRGQTNVTDAVTQNATGFTSTASPGNGWSGLASRGFVGNNAVMQLYDGTRFYAAAGTISFPFDTWAVERIEVLRGPASVLYGEGSIGGVINYIPKKPTEFFTHEAEVAIGTDGTRRIGLGSGGPITDQVSYRFDVSGLQSEGWVEPEGDFNKVALSAALAYRPTKNLKLTISNDYGDQSPMRYFGAPLINGVIPDAIRFKNFNVTDSDVNFIDNWTQFKTEWEPADWISVRNVAYRMTTNRHYKNTEFYDYQEDGPNAGLVQRDTYLEIFHDQEQIGNRFDAAFRTPLSAVTKNELVVGFDVNQIDFQRNDNFSDDGLSFVDPFNVVSGQFQNPGGTVPGFTTDTFQYALFAEDRLTLSKELSIVAGIRYDEPTVEREDLRTGNRFERGFSDVSWRAGAVFSPIADLAFYGQYATGIDPSGPGGLITLRARDAIFEPASGRQIEVGVKQSLWHGLGEWTLAAYDIQKKNLLSPDPNDPRVIRQVGQQSSRGIELSAAIQLTETLRYEGNASVLHAQYDDFQDPDGSGINFAGNRPNNVPEQIVNNWVSWEFLPGWEGYVGVQWVGRVFGDDANISERPAFTVVNLGLDYAVTEKSAIALRVFNVFDELYATDGGSVQWQLAPPRTGELSYRIKY